MCSLTIQRASKSIAKTAGSLDGQLFVVKHLLILREQVSPGPAAGCSRAAGYALREGRLTPSSTAVRLRDRCLAPPPAVMCACPAGVSLTPVSPAGGPVLRPSLISFSLVPPDCPLRHRLCRDVQGAGLLAHDCKWASLLQHAGNRSRPLPAPSDGGGRAKPSSRHGPIAMPHWTDA